MSRLVLRAIAALAALLALVALGAWVFGLGPFNARPSAAAKLQPKVEAAVAKTQAAAGAAITQSETQTKATAVATEKRTEAHVTKIRAAAPGAAAVSVPDRQFFLGVCESRIYAASPDCRGQRGEPEGGRAAPGPRAVRGR